MPYLTKSINESGDILYTLYDNIIIPTELTDVQYKSVIKKWNRLMVDWADAVFYYKNPDLHTVFKILIKTGIFSAYIDDLESSIYQIRAIQQ